MHDTDRPTLGLVLGGGGARGLAHIGVLERLEAAGLAPDVLVGVSMGAIIGATYAVREDWSPALREEDWSRLPVVNEALEGDLPQRASAYGRTLRRLAPTMTHWTPSKGFSEDARATLVDLMGPEATFADCRLPFAAIATDLRAGERVVLREGSLNEAALASGSIPGLAHPVEWDGASLVDGGFSDPAPVDVARDLGAEVVVAVHVGLPAGEEPAENWSGAMLQALEAGHRAFAESRFRHADLVLRPAFSSRTRMLDFSAVAELVAVGEACVEAELEGLAALAGA